MPAQSRLLVVRLRNWVGDVTLGLPMLQRLADAGYALQLVGKGWAVDLLAGQGWPVQVLPKALAERVRLLRRLGRGVPPDGGIHALCLPDSFSSALEFRLAGLPALGHAWEGRSLLLKRALPRPRGVHELEVYWRLGSALLGQDAPVPAEVNLRLADRHLKEAQALRRAHGIEPGCIFICPFAGGTWNQQDKTWPDFAAFSANELQAFGRQVVICPGPGEEDIARQQFSSALMLPGVGLGAYAALLREAAVMVSNDTGPGHMAAAMGTPLVSVMGPSDPSLWRPWGSRVQLLGGDGAWPGVDAVSAAVARALQAAVPVG
jgi:heptosyltransferase-2